MVKQTSKKPFGAAAMGPGPGRPKGATNKTTTQLKEMILEALDRAGGEEYLLERALDPNTSKAFLTLVGKVLPLQVQGDSENPLKFEKIVRVIVQPDE